MAAMRRDSGSILGDEGSVNAANGVFGTLFAFFMVGQHDAPMTSAAATNVLSLFEPKRE